jgi:hypothetical protein
MKVAQPDNVNSERMATRLGMGVSSEPKLAGAVCEADMEVFTRVLVAGDRFIVIAMRAERR